MKIDTPINKNYCGVVVKINHIFTLDNCDNIVATNIFGYQVLISKEVKQGDIGIFFPAETQLSDRYCYENNLYRHSNLNKDGSQKGYFEDNRRIRAIKFRGNVSNGLFMPLTSLNFTGVKLSLLEEGNEFDILNGIEICKKYVIPRKENTRKSNEVDRGFIRADKKFMPEHIDTENFFRNMDKINPDSEVIVTQKIHGTSIRIAHTMVNHKKTFVEKIASWFGAKIIDTEYDYLYGSRKVIKDANNPNQNHFYEQDIWSLEGHKLDGLLPENYIVYAELIGYTPDGKEIQKNYTYNIPVGNCELYIYRIAIVNSKGNLTDLSWKQVKEFCVKNGLKHVPELFTTKASNLINNEGQAVKDLLDKRYFPEYPQCVYLGDNDLSDEGVCMRIDSLIPQIYKAKSPKFLEHETSLLDKGEEDLESSQNI